MFKDQLINELNDELGRVYALNNAKVIYEKIDEVKEPEPGPSIYEIELSPDIVRKLEKKGITRLYRFQYDAYRKILDGYNVVISAGTGTGKTEAFFLPILKKILEYPFPNPRSMIVYPTKALARDQLKRFIGYSTYGLASISIYDGDTPRVVRDRIASNPTSIIITNPDMIHIGLVHSPYIKKFVKNADIFVFDELHVYEGVFGSHLHHIVHRIKKSKDTKPQFIGSSATIGNPKEFAEMIFNEDFVEIRENIGRKGKVIHVLISTGNLSRWSIASFLAGFLSKNGLRFLIFVDSQQMAEMLTSIIRDKLDLNVMVHRAGLPADIRKDIENQLRDGVLQGVVATPTLELGIDIGVLDAVIMVSPPPSYAKYLQRAGRAGRRGKGYVFTILGDDPIDAYYSIFPDRFFNQELGQNVIEPYNEEISKLHLVAYLLQVGKCRVDELPNEWQAVLNELSYNALVNRIGKYIVVNFSQSMHFFNSRGNIRSCGPQVDIVDIEKDEVIATRELPTALLELYPGSIYIYLGKPYRTVKIDLHNMRAYVEKSGYSLKYYTKPLYTVNVLSHDVVYERETRHGIPIAYGKVYLELSVNGYVLKDVFSGETLSKEFFDEPIRYSYQTRAVLSKFPEIPGLRPRDHMEAFHAIEHVLISATRITCGAGLTDMGGISYPKGDIIIYDAVMGGSGLSKLLYERFEKTLETSYLILNKCDCEDGCPRCVYSPYCGNNNQVLSRRKAIYIIDHLILYKPTQGFLLDKEIPPIV